MPAPSGTVTLLFTDIEGWTASAGVRRAADPERRGAATRPQRDRAAAGRRAKGEAMDRDDAVGDAIAELDTAMVGVVDT